MGDLLNVDLAVYFEKMKERAGIADRSRAGISEL